MIYTIAGFMGSGKSTLGRLLSSRMEGSSFIDLDDHLEQMAGRKIPDIFREDGENVFRGLETEALIDAVSSYEGGTMFLSLGGGTLLRPGNREIIRAVSHCIYLRGTAGTLAKHLGDGSGRPVLQQGSSLEALLQSRIPIYESAARYIVDIDGKTPEMLAEEIETLLKDS